MPGGQQKFGQVFRIETRIDFAGPLSRGNARCEQRAPFFKNCVESFAQNIAVRTGLKTEVANEASGHPAIALELVGDDFEIAFQALTRSKIRIAERFVDESFQVIEVAVEHFDSKGLFRTKMIGERTLGSAGRRANIAHARGMITGSKHHGQASS